MGTFRQSSNAALWVGALIGTALVAGACGASAASAPGNTGTHSTVPAQQHNPAHHPKTKTSFGGVPALGLEGLGQPDVYSGCAGVGSDLYTTASRSHPITVLDEPKSEIVTRGFDTVGGGNCTTILTWTFSQPEQSWTGQLGLGIADATGQSVSFSINGKAVKVFAGGKRVSLIGLVKPVTVSVDLTGAHTFSIVVPGPRTSNSQDGPEFVVVANDHLNGDTGKLPIA